VNGMRLTLPVEDDEGIFTVYLADTREVVYRGPGKYKGVWDIMCVEGTQVQGQPGVFAWRGELYKQPVYDARGIATVLHAKTNELVYRGPGDSYVPGHPGMCVCVCVCVCVKVSVYTHTHTHTHTHTGNSAGAMPYVRIMRGHARAKRGRVMVDLARVVLKLVPSNPQV